jgi:hypothetical protein
MLIILGIREIFHNATECSLNVPVPQAKKFEIAKTLYPGEA